MRYIPDLIPAEKKILPEYFNGERHSKSDESKFQRIISYAIGILCFLVAIGVRIHPFVTLMLFGLGVLFFPATRYCLQKKLVVRFSIPFRLVVLVIGIAIFLPVLHAYNERNLIEANAQKVRLEKEAAEKVIVMGREKARKDTLDRILIRGKEFLLLNKYEQAFIMLDRASYYCHESNELSEVAQMRHTLASNQAIQRVKQGNYKEGLVLLDQLMSGGRGDGNTMYYRGLCCFKIGQMQEAVDNLKQSIAQGNELAKTLHEKINPIRQRVSYYVTRCCDGSTSDAKGRGACSHHDGVCNWNDPVYEEYRKY